jgi:hypothetical protein
MTMTTTLTKSDLVRFIRLHRYAVQASVSPAGAPQAAVVGIAVSDDLEIVFDTLASTRKLQNLRHNPAISFVVGGTLAGDERSLQLDGIADEPTGPDQDRLRQIYYAAFPDGPSRLSWPGLTYVRARPRWIRYSDFGQNPPLIVELGEEALR